MEENVSKNGVKIWAGMGDIGRRVHFDVEKDSNGMFIME
jgi:hypothetical protein